jgi:hypothetical protein
MPTTAVAKRSKETQREQPEEGSPPPEILAILTVERAGVSAGVLGAGVELRPAHAAATPALPIHGGALARESRAMAEEATTQ